MVTGTRHTSVGAAARWWYGCRTRRGSLAGVPPTTAWRRCWTRGGLAPSRPPSRRRRPRLRRRRRRRTRTRTPRRTPRRTPCPRPLPHPTRRRMTNASLHHTTCSSNRYAIQTCSLNGAVQCALYALVWIATCSECKLSRTFLNIFRNTLSVV